MTYRTGGVGVNLQADLPDGLLAALLVIHAAVFIYPAVDQGDGPDLFEPPKLPAHRGDRQLGIVRKALKGHSGKAVIVALGFGSLPIAILSMGGH